MNKNLKKIIITIIILILIAMNIAVYISHNSEKSKADYTNDNGTREQIAMADYEPNKNKVIDTVVSKKIADMEGDARIKAYYGTFLNFIEDKDYASAYNYLNDDFKANYFQTIEDFSDYMSKKYPKNRIVVKYNTVERKGEIFVLSVNISDGKDKNFQTFSENVVIREISANNFSISFSKDVRITGGRSE